MPHKLIPGAALGSESFPRNVSLRPHIRTMTDASVTLQLGDMAWIEAETPGMSRRGGFFPLPLPSGLFPVCFPASACLASGADTTRAFSEGGISIS